MKQTIIIWLSILSFALFSCREKQKEQSLADTKMEWKHTTWNFGEITRGEEVVHTFHYKNTGDTHLLIKKIETGCGCTTVKYERDPIPPGKEGKIEIAFNSTGRYGKQYKEIRIFANVPAKQVTLSFTANVKE